MNEVNIVDKPTVIIRRFEYWTTPWIAEDNEEESLEFINNCNPTNTKVHLDCKDLICQRYAL